MAYGFGGGPAFRACCGLKIDRGIPRRLGIIPVWSVLIFVAIWVDKRAKQHEWGIFRPNRCAIAHDFGGVHEFRAYCASKIIRGMPRRLGIIPVCSTTSRQGRVLPSILTIRTFTKRASGKKNFTDLSKSPHGHSKKVHPKKSGRDSSRDLSVPVLIRTIRRSTKEKVQMASEVSSMLRNQVAERASAKEEANILQAELDLWTRRLETEKNDG
ncbi:hypothetical protein BC332_33871 [Capsicum chinense]|nr:hypothetical protein BC332_33871 [Capsicum chinense]